MVQINLFWVNFVFFLTYRILSSYSRPCFEAYTLNCERVMSSVIMLLASRCSVTQEKAIKLHRPCQCLYWYESNVFWMLCSQVGRKQMVMWRTGPVGERDCHIRSSCTPLINNNYSSSLNVLWVNSSWGRKPNELLSQRPWGWEE